MGDGQTIKIRSDMWSRGKEDFCVNQEGGSSNDSGTKVCHFFQEGRKMWDEDKIRSRFNEEDADAILRTRILQICTTDRITWVPSNNDQYTVKTGYQIWHQTIEVIWVCSIQMVEAKSGVSKSLTELNIFVEVLS